MKKSVLALAVAGAVLASNVASAAVVYDKDGTTMEIGGRVQAAFYNGHFDLMENKDHTIADQVRLNVSGRTKLYEGIYAFGFWEHRWDHDGDSTQAQETTGRDAYVGVDFEKFGSLRAGRYPSAAYYATELTDVYEDVGCVGAPVDDQRNSGKVTYSWSGYGVDFNIDYQTAVNNYQLPGYLEDVGDLDIDGGFAVSAGYSSPDVLFGPIKVRAAYEYLKGQDDLVNRAILNNVKSWAVGLGWGGEEGPFVAAQFNLRDFKFRANSFSEDGYAVPDYKTKGFEVIAGYNFTCGVTVVAGYETLKVDFKETDQSVTEGNYKDYTVRKVPVLVNYALNDNFNIWTEAQFDANSSNVKNVDDERIVPDKTLFAIGARYNF